jgi:hypothetical protein
MKLMMVNHGNVLHDPKAAGLNKVWLLSGQTLDVDDPWVAREIAGQEYKLVPAPVGAVLTSKAKWPTALLVRYTASMPAITPDPPEPESGSVEFKRRGRKKESKG